MSTALDIIKRSLRLLGVYPLGEEPSADESQDALSALNALMDSLANTGAVYAKTLDTISLSANVPSITVGPTGGTVTTRPVEVLPESYYVIGDVTYPLTLLTSQQYSDIGLKSVTGLPAGMWVQPDMPNITLTFWPVPGQDATLKLWSNKQITSSLTLTAELSLPPGYERMVAYLLAEDLAPEYEVMPSPEVVKQASQARRVLKRTNFEVPQLDMPVGPSNLVFKDIREL